MSVRKEKDKKTFEINVRVKDAFGRVKRVHKRGFKTKKEAKKYEAQLLINAKSDVDMSFRDFYSTVYLPNFEKQIRLNTMETKRHIVDKKILPDLGDMRLCDIKKATIIEWQNKMKDKGYSEGYLKTINNQLNAILNYAVTYFEDYKSPHVGVESMGKKTKISKEIWTVEQFETFLNSVSNKYESYVMFQLLFYCGMRLSELLALDISDIDFGNKTLTISKGYQRINRQDVITPPKNQSSYRTISLPNFIVEVLKEYINKLPYNEGRLFNYTKSFLEYEMKRGIELSGNPPTTIHALRHACISYLLYRGVPLIEIQKQVGHSAFSNETLDTYAHVYAEAERRIANIFDDVMKERGGSNER